MFHRKTEKKRKKPSAARILLFNTPCRCALMLASCPKLSGLLCPFLLPPLRSPACLYCLWSLSG